jgi:hypothetical protein
MTEEKTLQQKYDELKQKYEQQEKSIDLMGKRLFLIREAFKENMKVLTTYTDKELDDFITSVMLNTDLVDKISPKSSFIKPN